MQIIFIGGGNIAEAIFSKLEKLNLDIVVVQKNIIKRNNLAEKYPFIRFLSTLDFTPEADDIVILAVKPQDAKDSCNRLPKISGTIASVMSGITTDSLALWLGNNKIARIMPNTPAKLGLAVSGIYFSENISDTDRKVILDIMASIGKTYIFDNEKFIDKITATAGSAPAYIFYFIEAMTNTAIEEFGFTAEDALDITLQVFKGSLALIENNPDVEVKQLRANVTSKNGTTEQAINVFDKAKLKQIITEAEIACYKRARELGNTFK